MVDIDALQRGAVVRPASGGPYMTVRGFKPLVPPGVRQPGRTQVTCIVWGNRVGFVEKDFYPEELIYPPVRTPTADAFDEVDAAE